jgi:hypothetical protein
MDQEQTSKDVDDLALLARLDLVVGEAPFPPMSVLSQSAGHSFALFQAYCCLLSDLDQISRLLSE